MNEIAARGDTRMTVREVADQLGCSPETVKGHIRELFPGLMRNGKTTYLNEKQVTIILEKMKQTANHYDSAERNPTYNNLLQVTETALTPALRLEMLYRQIDEIKTAEINKLRADLAAASRIIEHQGAGLETIQRIAEAGGCILSDRDDMEATYRRRA
jgi:DNA-binding Lrp family transcriptional regulator